MPGQRAVGLYTFGAVEIFCPINPAHFVQAVPSIGPLHGGTTITLNFGVGIGPGQLVRARPNGIVAYWWLPERYYCI